MYRGKDCMKNFLKFLREHALKIINFNKKKMKLLTKELTFLGENTEKYITLTVPIEKLVTRIHKNWEEITKDVSYIL